MHFDINQKKNAIKPADIYIISICSIDEDKTCNVHFRNELKCPALNDILSDKWHTMVAMQDISAMTTWWTQ